MPDEVTPVVSDKVTPGVPDDVTPGMKGLVACRAVTGP